MSEVEPKDTRRRVSLPELGQGHHIVVKNSHIEAFYELWGADHTSVVIKGLIRFDTGVMKEMLKRCIFDADGKVRPSKLDDFDAITMSELSDRLLDGFMLCLHGRTYAEHSAWLESEAEKRAAKGEAEAEPSPRDPADLSAPSAGQPTGQD